MMNAVKSTGSFDADVDIVLKQGDIVVFSTDPCECYILKTIDNDLWFVLAQSAAVYYAINGVDGRPSFSYKGVAYVEVESLVDFEVGDYLEAKDFYSDSFKATSLERPEQY